MRELDAQVDDGFANALVARLNARMRTLPVCQLAELVVRKIERQKLHSMVRVRRRHRVNRMRNSSMGEKCWPRGKCQRPANSSDCLNALLPLFSSTLREVLPFECIAFVEGRSLKAIKDISRTRRRGKRAERAV
jgi:hypothetical protein